MLKSVASIDICVEAVCAFACVCVCVCVGGSLQLFCSLYFALYCMKSECAEVYT